MRVMLLSMSAVACALSAQPALSQVSNYDAMIARHAAANGLPESLVRRVMMKESGGRSHLVSAGNYGLMQIRHGTARGMGYSGSAQGLLDPETNMTYAVKYLAGAYRVAGGNHDRAVSYYQRGYYYAAKRQGVTQVASTTGLAPVETSPPSFSLASAPPAPKVAPVVQPVAVAAVPTVVPVVATQTVAPKGQQVGKPLNLLGQLKQTFITSNVPAAQQRQLAKRDDVIQQSEMRRQQTQRDARPDVR